MTAWFMELNFEKNPQLEAAVDVKKAWTSTNTEHFVHVFENIKDKFEVWEENGSGDTLIGIYDTFEIALQNAKTKTIVEVYDQRDVDVLLDGYEED